MQHRRRVDVLERAEDLVQEVLGVLVGETLPRVDDSVQIRLHEL